MCTRLRFIAGDSAPAAHENGNPRWPIDFLGVPLENDWRLRSGGQSPAVSVEAPILVQKSQQHVLERDAWRWTAFIPPLDGYKLELRWLVLAWSKKGDTSSTDSGLKVETKFHLVNMKVPFWFTSKCLVFELSKVNKGIDTAKSGKHWFFFLEF